MITWCHDTHVSIITAIHHAYFSFDFPLHVHTCTCIHVQQSLFFFSATKINLFLQLKIYFGEQKLKEGWFNTQSINLPQEYFYFNSKLQQTSKCCTLTCGTYMYPTPTYVPSDELPSSAFLAFLAEAVKWPTALPPRKDATPSTYLPP